MRGQTLLFIRNRLKAELGDALETNDAADEQYNYLLSAEQESLANQYEWNFLIHRWDLACTPGTRYYNIPSSDVRGVATEPSFENNIKAEVFYNQRYLPLDYGIEMRHYNQSNSDQSERLDPIQRWQVATNEGETSNANQIEVWPLPSTAQTVRFTGQRELNAFGSDTDKADLDDLLIVFSLAARRLALREHKSAGLMQRKFETQLANLRQGYPTSSDKILLGQSQQIYRRSNYPVIVVASS